MALFTIDDAISRKVQQNHKTDYEWFVELPDLDIGAFDKAGVSFKTSGLLGAAGSLLSSLVSGVGETVAIVPSNDRTPQEIVSHRVYSITTPYTTFESNKNTDKGSFWYSAMHSDIGNLTLVIDEMEDCNTLQYINDWMDLLKNEDGTHNLPWEYKRNIIFYQLNRKKDEIHKSVYTGYYPVEISPVSWSYDGTSVLQYSVTFTGDSVTHEKSEPGFLDKFN